MSPISRRLFLAAGCGTALLGIPAPSSAQNSFSKRKLKADSWPLHRYDGSNTANASAISIKNTPAKTWSKAVNDPGISSRNSGGLSAPIRKHRIIVYITDEAVVARGSANGEMLWTSSKQASCSSEIYPGVNGKYVLTGNEQVTAWDIETGDEIWETDLPDMQVATSFKFRNSTVFFAANSATEGWIIALDIKTGTEQWRTGMDHPISQELAVDEDHVVGITDGGDLKSLRIADGISLTEISINFGEEYLSPIIWNNLIYVTWIGTPTSESKIKDLEPKGVVTIYSKSSGGKLNEVSRLPNPDLEPVLGSDLILSRRDGQIFKPDDNSSTKEWNNSIDELSAAPVVVDDTLLAGTNNGQIIGLNPESGRERWRHSVLEEPIRGIIGGKNAIYVTGSEGTIGGIHYEPSIDARVAIQTLLKNLITTAGYGFDRSRAIKYLQTAFHHLTDGRYEDAQEAASEGQMVLTKDIENIETTQQTIQNVSERARSLRDSSNYDPEPILNKTKAADEALKNGNPERARALAEKAKSEITDTENKVENASARIENLTETIDNAQQNKIPVQNASTDLSKAKQSLKTGEFGAASRLANQTNSDLRNRINHITKFRSKKEGMEALIETADDTDIQISSGQELYNESTEEYAAEKYEAAAELMTEAYAKSQTTISTATKAESLIREAEKFDPIPPFVEGLATTLGSATQLNQAKVAYENNKYESAVASAEQALSHQTQARVIVNGGVLSGTGVIWYIKRHDGISKAADILVQLTENKKEE